MNAFTRLAKDVPEFKSLAVAINKGRLPVGVTGATHIHKAHIISSLCMGFKKHALIILPEESQATRMCADLNSFGINAYVYPARDFSYKIDETVSREYEHRRLNVLDRMLTGEYDAVVASAEAVMQLTVLPEVLLDSCFSIKSGEEYDRSKLEEALIKCGYSLCEQIDGPGQYSVRGGLLDFFPPYQDEPCRIEFWGDSIDSIFTFDLDTQRRKELLEEVRVTPAREILISESELVDLIEKHIKENRIRGDGFKMLSAEIDRIKGGIKVSSADKYIPLICPNSYGLFDYAADCMLFVCDSFAVKSKFDASVELQRETIKSLFEEKILCRGLERYGLGQHELFKFYGEMGAVYLDSLPRGSFDTGVKELISFSAKQIAPWNGSIAAITEDIEGRRNRSENTFVIFGGTEKAAEMIAKDLAVVGIDAVYHDKIPSEFAAGTVNVLPGVISFGFEYPGVNFSVFTYRAQVLQKRKAARKTSRNAFNSLTELHRGEYVVHAAHGIGIFEGINTLEASGTVKDYIKIRYDKGDILYVPVTQLDQVSKYIGGSSEERTIKLNKLGGTDWQKTRSRVKASVKDMAKELIALYSQRLQSKGFAFSPDIDMQNDFESRFEYVETDDQIRCIREIKADMEKPCPMDRLLCGDVGFGKTEVALRAVFKCIADGKQVAILVPTTILALQHYQTLLKRFEGFPVEIGMLSRFCSKKDIEKTLTGLRRGSVDVVVGTHRLISKDVKFRDPGLIVIDEEQRFGVAQKEKLKTLYPDVDVLTLTATPIPRTLNMAMTGIRDMSVIEEAPLDRQPVQTYVMEYDMDVLAQAMEQELRRGGQVYYLYNKVETIERKALEIKKLLPDANVAIGHGKMSEDELSEIWRRLIDGEIDILVCTTIIETGVDVPNVNTLIIENADRMGLAQLHQIRGRVGRSSRRASAYFTFTKGKQLTEIAERRLEAIREFTEFGSGFHIAMRDLELRGAGNVLGASQHGQMDSVGYDMYIKLLEQAICEEKGIEPPEPEKECLIDLPIDAHIPEKYIASLPQRLQMYKRIADIRTKEDALDVVDELIDRFGDPPVAVLGLVRVSAIRANAARNNIVEITYDNGRIIFKTVNPDMDKICKVATNFSNRFTTSNLSGKPSFTVKMKSDENNIALIEKILECMDA